MRNDEATLVGDGIENPGNALAMLHAAEMYGVECRFRDTKGLQESELLEDFRKNSFPVTTGNDIRDRNSRIIAFDNLPGASDVYGFRAGRNPAIIVGNERRGLSHEFRDLATDNVQIPMLSRRINCLNVAASSAVALYYLCRVKSGPMAKRIDPASRRPSLLLASGKDHIEFGSAVRSAAAFGWSSALVEDRGQVWFGSDRITRSQGRAAARRSKNVIRLVPCSSSLHGFPYVTVVTASRRGVPLHRANLARGPKQLVVIPDESHLNVDEEDWTRLGKSIQFAHLDIPVQEFTYHFRLVATIAMAEISRQVGRRLPGRRIRKRRPPIYERSFDVISGMDGEDVWLEDLMDY